MAKQVRDPFRILHIGLTPWHLLDVLRVRHHNLQGSFQDGVDRLPVNSRTLHRHMGAAFREQPFAQPHQLSRSRAERAYLLLNPSVLADHQQTGHYCGLMYVQPTTAFDQSLHKRLHGRRLLRRRSVADTVMRPSRLRVRQKVVPLPTRVSLFSGICVVASFRTTFKQSLTTSACTTETDPASSC